MLITLIRHAHTDWNSPQKRFQGHFDVHLSNQGIDEALLKSNFVGDSDYVYSSTASRCIETANILLKNTQKIISDERLLEINTGIFTGRTNDDVAIEEPEWWQIWKSRPELSCFPKGESLLELSYRVLSFLDELVANHAVGDRVLVLTHGGPVRVCKSILYNDSLSYFWDYPVNNLDVFSMNHKDIKLLLRKGAIYFK